MSSEGFCPRQPGMVVTWGQNNVELVVAVGASSLLALDLLGTGRTRLALVGSAPARVPPRFVAWRRDCEF